MIKHSLTAAGVLTITFLAGPAAAQPVGPPAAPVPTLKQRPLVADLPIRTLPMVNIEQLMTLVQDAELMVDRHKDLMAEATLLAGHATLLNDLHLDFSSAFEHQLTGEDRQKEREAEARERE